MHVKRVVVTERLRLMEQGRASAGRVAARPHVTGVVVRVKSCVTTTRASSALAKLFVDRLILLLAVVRTITPMPAFHRALFAGAIT